MVDSPSDIAKNNLGDSDGDSLADGERDKESLVGGMNSQCTEVDRYGLMNEATRTLSGLSSADTDGSLVRHVPAGEDSASISGSKLLETPQKQPGTYSDSGYGGSSTRDNMRTRPAQGGELPRVEERGNSEEENGDDSQNLLKHLCVAEQTSFDTLWDN